MPARVSFMVDRDFAWPADRVFAELIDWRSHAEWVPLTTVVVSGDGGVGTEFVATSGIRPVAIPDRMQVVALDRSAMVVDIVKLGPVITGTVRLTVTATGPASCRLQWREDVDVPKAPSFAAGALALGSRMAFRHALGRLDRRLRKIA